VHTCPAGQPRGGYSGNEGQTHGLPNALQLTLNRFQGVVEIADFRIDVRHRAVRYGFQGGMRREGVQLAHRDTRRRRHASEVDLLPAS
jgi:hypothetical protein